MVQKLNKAAKSGGILIKAEKGKLHICLVTSRRNQHKYIFPKGNLDAGEVPMQTAMRESFEEAGVTGAVLNVPLIFNQIKKFHIADKIRKGDFIYYPIWVEKIHKKWPEQFLRKRKWVAIDEILTRKRYKHLRKAFRVLAKAALLPSDSEEDTKAVQKKLKKIQKILKAQMRKL